MVIYFTDKEFNAIRGILDSIPGTTKDLSSSIASSRLIKLDMADYNNKGPRHRLRINKEFAAEYLERIQNLAGGVMPMVLAGVNLCRQLSKDLDGIVRKHNDIMLQREYEQATEKANDTSLKNDGTDSQEKIDACVEQNGCYPCFGTEQKVDDKPDRPFAVEKVQPKENA